MSWWGVIPIEFPGVPTTASYSIDDKPLVSFQLKGTDGSGPSPASQYHQMFFQTPELSPGPHRLRVVHQGDEKTTPLTMSYLVIQDGNFTSPLRNEPSIFDLPKTPDSAPPGNGNVKDSPATSTNIGPIVGGVVGGVVVLVVAALLIFYFLRKRKSRQPLPAIEVGVVQPYDAEYPQASFRLASPPGTPYYPVPTEPAHSIYSQGTSQLTYNPSSTTSPSHYGESMISVQPLRKGQMAAVDARNARNQGSSSEGSGITAKSRVIHHEDSGIRLPGSDGEDIVDVPPTYTPR